jgi:hypothetical protein
MDPVVAFDFRKNGLSVPRSMIGRFTTLNEIHQSAGNPYYVRAFNIDVSDEALEDLARLFIEPEESADPEIARETREANLLSLPIKRLENLNRALTALGATSLVNEVSADIPERKSRITRLLSEKPSLSEEKADEIATQQIFNEKFSHMTNRNDERLSAALAAAPYASTVRRTSPVLALPPRTSKSRDIKTLTLGELAAYPVPEAYEEVARRSALPPASRRTSSLVIDEQPFAPKSINRSSLLNEEVPRRSGLPATLRRPSRVVNIEEPLAPKSINRSSIIVRKL